MKLSADDDHRRLLVAHTRARLSNGCPWSVQVQVAALVGRHEIAACAPQFTLDAPSTWTTTAVTKDGRLVRVRMEFDAERYDLEGEQIAERQRRSVAPVVHEASARRLSDAVSLDIKKVHRRFDGFGQPSRDEFNVGDVSLRFSDGHVVDLGVDQASMYDADDLARTDELLDVVRVHTGL